MAEMRALAAQYPRFGYAGFGSSSSAQGHDESGSDSSYVASGRAPGTRRRPRRRIADGRPRPLPPTGINQVWAYDFVFDACANGQTLKCLTVMDEFTRECLAIDVAGSIRSGRVIEVLSQLVSVHGAPRYLRSDNGPEFVSRAILRWLQKAIETALIDPGQAMAERRDEASTASSGTSAQAAVVPEPSGREGRDRAWRRQYNAVRPHSSLGNLTPAEFKAIAVLLID